ncbi:peptidase A4 family-domain-containing protein [Truncatella angustata]|uniref:Peptidase A4 family-domain-containing protein n=1 Tax=Truncatella angustata TaxID=152316 RepID=A0A9P8UUD7_9PEZI|nr:peptidase A4 family-domain-containing protein [Truncatella angustata]KAH6658544.1 peptidase A4 family-domain-containing protein [Truncatella angustata]
MKLSVAVLNALFVAALAAPAPGSAPRSNTKARLDARRAAARGHQKSHHHDSGSSSSRLPSAFPSALPSGSPSPVRSSAAVSAPSSTAAPTSSSSATASHSTSKQASSDVDYNESWAGSVVTGTGMTGVSATFEVPTPKIPTDGQTSATEHTASVWIGMDGYNCDGGLWQAGVDATIDAQGTSYYAWYEWYPENTVVVDLGDLAAGDSISVNLTSSGEYTSGYIIMENQSTGKTFTKTVTDSDALCGSAVEWIMEDLVVDGSENGLANFGTVTFTDAVGTSKTGSVSPSSGQLLDIQDSAGSALTASSTTSDTVVIVYQ